MKETEEARTQNRQALRALVRASRLAARDLRDFLLPSVQDLMFTPAKIDHLARIQRRLSVNSNVAIGVLTGRRKAPEGPELGMLLNENVDHIDPTPIPWEANPKKEKPPCREN